MKRQLLCLVLGLLATFSLHARQPSVLEAVGDTAACRRWVDAQMEKMTLKQKIGQLFIYTAPPEYTQYNKNRLRKIIGEYEAGQSDQLSPAGVGGSSAHRIRWGVGAGDAPERRSRISL